MLRRLVRNKSSSLRWVQRQTKDHYARESRSKNYRSRASFKLLELNEKYRLITPQTNNIVDLGFAPGAWTQVALEVAKKNHVRPSILGVDLIQCNPPDGARFIQGDIFSKKIHADISDFFQGKPIDLIMSDMMANTSGVKDNDHFASMELCDAAIILAFNSLHRNGTLLMKFFTGKEDQLLRKKMEKLFGNVYIGKPNASRDELREMYIIGKRRKLIRLEEVFDQK